MTKEQMIICPGLKVTLSDLDRSLDFVCIGSLIYHGIHYSEIADNELAKMWQEAAELLEKIEEYIETYSEGRENGI